MIRAFVLGIVATLVALAVFLYVAISAGLVPANADARPPKIERWIASRSLHAALAREAPKTPDPLPLDDTNLIAGIKLYAQNCAVCHGAADAARSNIAFGLYQHPPQLAKDGVEDDPEGVTYWKIYHGIRLTGMPAFGKTFNETQIWQVALFLKHMDALPAASQRAWKSVKSVGSPTAVESAPAPTSASP
jgi:thiosulfate dehydrogenase